MYILCAIDMLLSTCHQFTMQLLVTVPENEPLDTAYVISTYMCMTISYILVPVHAVCHTSVI